MQVYDKTESRVKIKFPLMRKSINCKLRYNHVYFKLYTQLDPDRISRQWKCEHSHRGPGLIPPSPPSPFLKKLARAIPRLFRKKKLRMYCESIHKHKILTTTIIRSQMTSRWTRETHQSLWDQRRLYPSLIYCSISKHPKQNKGNSSFLEVYR